MPATFIDPVEITPGTPNAWTDADVSASVPVGATGVIIHVTKYGTGDRAFGFRKNGSTDNRTAQIVAGGATSYGQNSWNGVGVDANRILELYVGSTTDVDVYLVGYFTSEAVFFTNAPDKSLGATGAWTDIDISADTGADTAIGAFIECVSGVVGSYTVGLRKNGSSDNRTGENAYQRYFFGGAIGVDGNEILEGYIPNTDVDFFLLGYMKSQATFNTNAEYIGEGTGAWADFGALPSGAIGGIIEINSGANWKLFGLRKNGSAENITGNDSPLAWGIVEADANRIIERYGADGLVDFFLTGYIESVPLITEKFFTITETSVLTFTKWRQFLKEFIITVQGIISFEKWKQFLKEFSIAVQGIVSFQKWKLFLKEFAITVQGIVSFEKWKSYLKEFLITVQGIVSFQKWRMLFKQFAITISTIVSFWEKWMRKIYYDIYLRQGSSYQKKYQKQGTSYSDKYSKQGTSYQKKYQ